MRNDYRHNNNVFHIREIILPFFVVATDCLAASSDRLQGYPIRVDPCLYCSRQQFFSITAPYTYTIGIHSLIDTLGRSLDLG